jgi:hypothetical protein
MSDCGDERRERQSESYGHGERAVEDRTGRGGCRIAAVATAVPVSPRIKVPTNSTTAERSMFEPT